MTEKPRHATVADEGGKCFELQRSWLLRVTPRCARSRPRGATVNKEMRGKDNGYVFLIFPSMMCAVFQRPRSRVTVSDVATLIQDSGVRQRNLRVGGNRMCFLFSRYGIRGSGTEMLQLIW